MKDGQPLTINGDTWTMAVKVTERSTSTYVITLTILDRLDTVRLLGCNITIIITNILGSDSATVKVAGEFVIDSGPFINGVLITRINKTD